MRLYDLESRFTTYEFACPCACGFGTDPDDISQELITKLNILRLQYGYPLVVTSGARCVDYNGDIGGAINSAHTPDPEYGQCQAADLLIRSGQDRHTLIKLALHLPFHRIGVAENFLHLDVADHLPSPAMWTYNKG